MLNFIGRLFDHPRTWPKSVRIGYLLTFPVSIPLHMTINVMICIMMIVIFVVLTAVTWVAEVVLGESVESYAIRKADERRKSKT